MKNREDNLCELCYIIKRNYALLEKEKGEEWGRKLIYRKQQGKKITHIQRNPPILHQQTSQQKPCNQERMSYI